MAGKKTTRITLVHTSMALDPDGPVYGPGTCLALSSEHAERLVARGRARLSGEDERPANKPPSAKATPTPDTSPADGGEG